MWGYEQADRQYRPGNGGMEVRGLQIHPVRPCTVLSLAAKTNRSARRPKRLRQEAHSVVMSKAGNFTD